MVGEDIKNREYGRLRGGQEGQKFSNLASVTLGVF